MKKANNCDCGSGGRVHKLLMAVETDGVAAVVDLMDHLAFKPADGLDLQRTVALHRWVDPNAMYRFAEYVAFDCKASIQSARLNTALYEVGRILKEQDR